MKPMLARTVGPRYDQYPCYVQPKLNGVRVLCQKMDDGKWLFQSRDEKLWQPEVVSHLSDELNELGIGYNVILDGEFYRHGWRLQRINGAIAVNRRSPIIDTREICLHVFDVVQPDRMFSNRWLEIYTGLKDAGQPHIKAVPTALASDWNEVEKHFHLYTSNGYEGVMLRPDGRYEFGEHIGRNGNTTQYRSKTLWKYKAWQDDEFFCIGVTEGEGKAAIGIGALVLRSGWQAIFKVGTGFTDEERVEFAKNPPVNKFVKVRYLCLTAEGIPFNPSFLAVIS